MAARQVVLLRHGQTDWNVQGRWQGSADIPLNATGREQAKQAGALLGENFCDIGRVVSSDKSRALETAKIVAAAHPDLSEADVVTEPRLHEHYAGAVEGLTREESRQQFGDQLRELGQGKDLRLGGGERPSEVAARGAEAIYDHIAATAEGTTLLCVGHGGALRLAAASLCRIPLDSMALSVMRNCHCAVIRPIQFEAPLGLELCVWNWGPDPVVA